MEELEEGEIVEGKEVSDEGRREQRAPATPKKNSNSNQQQQNTDQHAHRCGHNGRELEEGELVSSDEEEEEEQKVATSTTNDNTSGPASTQTSPKPTQIKEKRGVENKENRVDKKKKGLVSIVSLYAVPV